MRSWAYWIWLVLLAVVVEPPAVFAVEPLPPPRVEMEIEQVTFPWRPKPPAGPVCPPVAPAIPTAPAAPTTNPDGTPRVPTAEELARQATPENPNTFAQGTEGGGTSSRTFNDNFNGDFGGIIFCQRIVVGITPQPPPPQGPSFRGIPVPPGFDPVYKDLCTMAGSRYNGILITDNDSPRPTDRAYFGFNHYNGINPSLNPSFDRMDMNRQTIGFEKTFLNGDASFGMRLPFIQIDAPMDLGQRNVGDLSVLLKYAFFNERETGNLMSVGLVVTAPTGTGNDIELLDGSSIPTSVLLQPWLGGVRMFQRGYTQMISSMLVPTSTREPTLFNNSVAAGYFLYQRDSDRFLNAIVPVMEAHLRTPLTFREHTSPVYLQDQLNLTFGVHFRSRGATVSPAFTVPTLGPNPFNYEASLWVNFRF